MLAYRTGDPTLPPVRLSRRGYFRITATRWSMLEAVMNSIRNGLGMRETEIARELGRPWNPHFYAILAQVHNTL